jgi:hypothetical protein
LRRSSSLGRITNVRRESLAIDAAKTEADDRYLVRGEGGTLGLGEDDDLDADG